MTTTSERFESYVPGITQGAIVDIDFTLITFKARVVAVASVVTKQLVGAHVKGIARIVSQEETIVAKGPTNQGDPANDGVEERPSQRLGLLRHREEHN